MAEANNRIAGGVERSYSTGGRVPLKWKLFYGLGQAGSAISGWGFDMYLFIYYNQVLGLSGSYTGLGFAIALVCDAISDPVIGSWSDGLKSRLGRRHPFMLLSIPALAVSYFALFWPPAGLEDFSSFCGSCSSPC